MRDCASLSVTDDKMNDIVFISLEPWDEVWRRNQFLVREFADRKWGKVLYVVPQRDISNAIRRLEWERLRTRSVFSPKNMSSVYIVQPTKLFPQSIRLARKLYEFTFRSFVRRWVHSLGMKNPVLWINDHSASHIVDRFAHGPLIYDITDDWISSGQSSSVLTQIVDQDRFLCERAEATIVCSSRLLALKRELVSDVSRLHLIQNAVDAGHYAREYDLEPQTLTWERPVYMYTGTIHADRIDLDLVKKVADVMAKGTIAFVGPSHLTASEQQSLTATGRVRFVGQVGYDELPRWMCAASAFLVPHRVTEFTESLNPIKLWEYLASGKPIISTAVAGFREYPGLIRLVGDARDCVQAMNESLEEDVSVCVKRRQAVQHHSWASRVDEVEQIIRSIN